MGNSHSIKLSDFHDQLVSTCLWCLRKDEIIAFHQKQQDDSSFLNYFKKKNNIQLNGEKSQNVETADIPFLYTRRLSQQLHGNRNSITSRNSIIAQRNLQHSPEKLTSDLIDRYLNHILQDKEEVNKLLVEIIYCIHNNKALMTKLNVDTIWDLHDNQSEDSLECSSEPALQNKLENDDNIAQN